MANPKWENISITLLPAYLLTLNAKIKWLTYDVQQIKYDENFTPQAY